MSKERRCSADRRRIGILESFVAGVNSIESIFGTFVVFGLVGGSTLLSVDAGAEVGAGDGFDLVSCLACTDSSCMRSIIAENKSVAQGKTANGLVLVQRASNAIDDVRNAVGR